MHTKCIRATSGIRCHATASEQWILIDHACDAGRVDAEKKQSHRSLRDVSFETHSIVLSLDQNRLSSRQFCFRFSSSRTGHHFLPPFIHYPFAVHLKLAGLKKFANLSVYIPQAHILLNIGCCTLCSNSVSVLRRFWDGTISTLYVASLTACVIEKSACFHTLAECTGHVRYWSICV